MCKRLSLVVCNDNGADHIKDFQYPSNKPFGVDFFELEQAQWRDLSTLFPLEYSRVCEVEFLGNFVKRGLALQFFNSHRNAPLLMSIGKS